MPGFGPIADGPIASIAAAYAASLTESATATDTVSGVNTASLSLTETATATDVLDAGYGGPLTETATATDAVDGAAAASRSEAATATDTLGMALEAPVSITEAATADDAETTEALVVLVEAATATDAPVPEPMVVSVSITESANATDTIAFLELEGSVEEVATATDSLEAVLYARWDYLPTVISQYRNSPILMGLLDYFSQWVDQNYDVTQFYLQMWNIDTAEGYGLDVWGRIVGVERTLQVQTGSFFEFEQQNQSSSLPFGGGPFFSGNTSTESFVMSDDAFRQLILAKALSNICGGSIPAINQILMFLFPNMGNCYVTDGEDMTMEFVFGGALSPVQYAIISQTGVLPRPVGVAASIVEP